jgi:hypothetical protein
VKHSDRLSDGFDPAQSGVPGSPDRGQLRGGTGELRLVDPVVPLAARRLSADQPDAVENGEVFRHRLARERESRAQ